MGRELGARGTGSQGTVVSKIRVAWQQYVSQGQDGTDKSLEEGDGPHAEILPFLLQVGPIHDFVGCKAAGNKDGTEVGGSLGTVNRPMVTSKGLASGLHWERWQVRIGS